MTPLNRKIRIILGVPIAWTLFFASPSQAGSSDFNSSEKFYIYKDKPSPLNHFSVSGFMPDGKCLGFNDAWVDNCGGSRSCIQFKFDRPCVTRRQGWAGVYWLTPANNWGNKKGWFDLRGARKLVFWARGEKGGEVVTFKIGGLFGVHKHRDSVNASTQPIFLTKDWREYSIGLGGQDLSHVVGGFSWASTADENQSSFTFYLKDIYFI